VRRTFSEKAIDKRKKEKEERKFDFDSGLRFLF